MKLKIPTTFFIALLFLASCGEKSKKTPEIHQHKVSGQITLVGKKAKLVYPKFQAEVHYLSQSKLRWKTIGNDGKINEGDESISFKKIASGLFFVSWIEVDGTTVSQVIDTEKSTVSVYLTYHDKESPRSERSGEFIEGSWQEIR